MNGNSGDSRADTSNIVPRKSSVQGRGVFAASSLSAGQTIAYFEGYETDQNTRYALSADGKRFEGTGELRYINHSCDPNSHFDGRSLIASRDIAEGEEILIDYLATEDTIFSHFQCHCGADNCRGTI